MTTTLTSAEHAAVLRAISELDGKSSFKNLRKTAESILSVPEGSLDAKKHAIKEACREEMMRIEQRPYEPRPPPTTLNSAERAAVLRAIAELEGKSSQQKVRRCAETILGAPAGSLDAKKVAIKEVWQEEIMRPRTMPEVYVCIRTYSAKDHPVEYKIFAVCDSIEAAEHACREKARENGGDYEDDAEAPYEWEGHWMEVTRIQYEAFSLSSDTGPSDNEDDDDDDDGADEALSEGGAQKRPRRA